MQPLLIFKIMKMFVIIWQLNFQRVEILALGRPVNSNNYQNAWNYVGGLIFKISKMIGIIYAIKFQIMKYFWHYTYPLFFKIIATMKAD